MKDVLNIRRMNDLMRHLVLKLKHYLLQVLPTTNEAADSLATTEDTDSPTTIEDLLVTLKKVYKKFGDGESPKAIDILVKRLKSIKSSSQFNNYCYSYGSSRIRIGGAGRGKIPCQPSSIARKEPGLPRGAAPIGKGRKRMKAHIPRVAKRPRNLALSILNNQANAKSH